MSIEHTLLAAAPSTATCILENGTTYDIGTPYISNTSYLYLFHSRSLLTLSTVEIRYEDATHRDPSPCHLHLIGDSIRFFQNDTT